MLRRFINLNVRLSRGFDRVLPARFKVDGNRDFLDHFVPRWLTPGSRIVDVGGGKNPYLSIEAKISLRAHVTGVDISAEELGRAPAGAYDEVICCDIARHKGNGMADLCICQAVLEHVSDTEAAIRAIASLLKPGGIALIFLPSRNAVFARLNLLLPERLKRFLLFRIFPSSRRDQGFPSFYHRCTPSDFECMAQSTGLSVVDARFYYTSAYFTFFVPLHVVWRLWLLAYSAVGGRQASETFCYAFGKPKASTVPATAADGGQ